MEQIGISKNYNATETEDKWYSYWMEQGFFRSTPDEREPYCIVIPPPNVTGVLHMGHMLNNTLQDVLIRRARMMGKNACWVPGTDHASIATEAKVVNMLKNRGVEKHEISREEFIEYAWAWKEKHGGIILEQLKKLGASCDWDRTRFTMEESLSKAVLDVFVDLHSKGYIYKGKKMINWDPQAKTALSNEEVNHQEVNSKLFYIQYPLENSDEFITIATTRPETILGDTAICVHPKDTRYKHLKGKNAVVPLINRSIPIITDDYVDTAFGTGCLKITPAHDVNDYELGVKHQLEVINILNEDGTLNNNAQLFVGEDRFIARELIIKALEEKGLLVKVEDIINKVGKSERTGAVIEPRISAQWFCDMQKMVKPAMESVMNEEIKFYPANLKNTYRHWMENIRDWCISRQLWWGHRIPAYYCSNIGCEDVIMVQAAPPQKCAKCNNSTTIHQDEDVVDTWFSSWLWPISVFDGFENPDNEDINYYYPTNDLVTAPEILFFWVARMIMAGYQFRGEKPFKNVYFTGIVRDKLNRKMSKSLGNSPDPLELIEKHGADGVRVGMLLCSPAGNDLLFDEQLCEQGRNFTNKIWNASRLIKGWQVDEALATPNENKVAMEWFESKLNENIALLEKQFSHYKLSEALMTVYKLIWDDFCSWYLEMIKPAFQCPIDLLTYNTTIRYFEKLLQLIHPFMPFISEEIWHTIKEREKKDCIIISEWPKQQECNHKMLEAFENTIKIIVEIRNIRKQNQIPNKEPLLLLVKEDNKRDTTWDSVIIKLCYLQKISSANDTTDGTISFIVQSDEYFIPLQSVDVAISKTKVQEDLNYAKGFLQSIDKKLSNERFVNSAPPEVIEREKMKRNDMLAKIKILEKQLA